MAFRTGGFVTKKRYAERFKLGGAGWNAIREFPHSTGQLTDYTADWQGRVDSADKPFVARLAKILLAREADRIFDSQRTS